MDVSTNDTQKKSSVLSLDHLLHCNQVFASAGPILEFCCYLKTPSFLPPLKYRRRPHDFSRKLQGAIKTTALEYFTPS